MVSIDQYMPLIRTNSLKGGLLGCCEAVFDQAGSSRLRRMISQNSPANLTENITIAYQVDAGVVKINEPTRVWCSTLPSADSNNRAPITTKNKDKTQWIFIPAPR
jgi:hypothetical protein